LAASKWNLNEQLSEGARGGTAHYTRRLRNVLIGVQLSVALVLLAGAALLIQSYWRLTSVNPGFDPHQVLTLSVVLPKVKYPENAQRIQFFQTALQRIQGLPGVSSAGIVDYLPFAGPTAGTNFSIQGQPDPPPGHDRITNVFVVDNGFFNVLQIPLKRGRLFNNAEMQEEKHVVVITEELARQFFPDQDPIGRNITINMKDQNVPTQIIGIVGDVKNERLDTEALPAVFWPHPELPRTSMTFV